MPEICYYIYYILVCKFECTNHNHGFLLCCLLELQLFGCGHTIFLQEDIFYGWTRPRGGHVLGDCMFYGKTCLLLVCQGFV